MIIRLPRGRKNWPHKVCQHCGATFGPKPGHGAKDWRVVVFCSRTCSLKARAIPLEIRLAERGVRNEQTGCLEWDGYRDPKGYGRTGQTEHIDDVLVHRIAWIIARGAIPDGYHVLHRCDNPPCFEPSHLFLGTNGDNVADRVAKGRAQDIRGEKNGRAKIVARDIPVIRADRRRGADIAIEYGVTVTTINAIRSGRSWGHV